MTLQENKEWLHKCLYGYADAAFENRFKGILLTESAKFRMGTVMGFLATHEELIENFFDKLEWMNQHELVEVNSDGSGYSHKAPNKITKLSDDGCLFSFGFIFMMLNNHLDASDKRVEQLGPWKDVYAYGMNGGLIFHGCNNLNFSVDCSGENGPHWSIHT